jgi:SAM-dependent methyltransferase
MFDRLKRRTPQALRATMRHATRALTVPGDRSDCPQIAYDPQLLPPLRLMRTEGIDVLEEWFRWGEEWSVLLRAFGGLRVTSDVLEIGCGLGRIAFPLRFFLRKGTYRGFDISRQKIDFLQRPFHGSLL